MAKKNQSKRLTNQHKKSQGVIGIFGEEAKSHDVAVGKISHLVIKQLEKEFPQLSFRYRTSIKKEEINEALNKIDSELKRKLPKKIMHQTLLNVLDYLQISGKIIIGTRGILWIFTERKELNELIKRGTEI